MSGRVSAECRRARTALQDLHDAREAPSGVLAAHLEGCPACTSFQRFLERLPGDLRATLDESIAGVPARVGTSDLPRGTRRIRRSFVAPALAAAIAALIVIPSGFLAVSALRERAATREAVGVLVEDLFRTTRPAVGSTPGRGRPTSAQVLDSLLDDLSESAAVDQPGASLR